MAKSFLNQTKGFLGGGCPYGYGDRGIVLLEKPEKLYVENNEMIEVTLKFRNDRHSPIEPGTYLGLVERESG